MRTAGLRWGPRVAQIAALCMAGVSVLAQPASDPAEAARREAANLANPDTPQHSATLRLALQRTGDRFEGPDGSLDPTRSFGTSPLLLDVASEVLLLDLDPRYRAWLRQQPVIKQLDAEDQSVVYRVIGGNIVRGRGVFDQVGVLVGRGNAQICSGVLMRDRRTVMTAAHCVCEGPSQVVFGNNVGDAGGARFDVLGAWDRNGRLAAWRPPQTRCGLSESQRATLHGRDYGFVILDQKVNERIVSVTATFAAELGGEGLREGQNFYVVGFGPRNAQEDDARIMPGVKNFALSPIVSTRCAESAEDRDRYGCKGEHEFVGQRFYRPVAGGPVWKVGPCRGDSGGAAILDAPAVADSGEKTYLTIGLVSRSAPGASCGDAAIYTHVQAKHLDEITKASIALLAELEASQ